MKEWKEDLRRGLEEFTLKVFNDQEINKCYRKVLKSGLKLNAKQMYNILLRGFQQTWSNDKITRVLISYNGSIENQTGFKDFEARFKEDYKEIRKDLKMDKLRKSLENEYKHDLIDYIVDLPMTMSIQGILKDYKLTENDMLNNLIIDLAKLIKQDELVNFIIDYVESYDIAIEESYLED